MLKWTRRNIATQAIRSLKESFNALAVEQAATASTAALMDARLEAAIKKALVNRQSEIRH
jgi:hypothetical protein